MRKGTLMSMLLMLLLSTVVAIKPVIMMHGVNSDRHEMDTIADVIKLEHPGAVATSLPVFEKDSSFLHPLGKQVPGIIDSIRSLVAGNSTLYKDGYHFVCKSQGALLCRLILEEMNDHNVSHFVSLAGPQAGVYGQGFFHGAPKWIQDLAVDEIWRVAYTSTFQGFISDANMWRDAKHYDKYLQTNPVLPLYDGERTSAASLARFKANFVRLRRAVFCVGSGADYDGGIAPWQTGVWGSYDSSGHLVNMTEQPFYTNDTFGLRSLNESGRLVTTIVPGVSHGDWTGDREIIRKYILPHLD